jgi:hypothetical protein
MTSKILNRRHPVKHRGPGAPSGRPFAALPEIAAGGDEVAYIIAWTLGPPVSLIILFVLLFGV